MKITNYRERATGFRLELTWITAIMAAVTLALTILGYWIGRSWAGLYLLPLLLTEPLPRSLVRGRGPTTLKLEERGLTYSHRYGGQQWHWSELSAPELRHPRDPINRHLLLRLDRPIGWMARLTLPAVRARGTELHVRDIFGTPLDEIAAQLNKHRGRALASTHGLS